MKPVMSVVHLSEPVSEALETEVSLLQASSALTISSSVMCAFCAHSMWLSC